MSINGAIAPVRVDRQEIAATVRALVAQQLGVATKRVSDDAQFVKDLGADWLDRLELIIAVEDQFGLEIADSFVDKLEAVSDLIQFVERSPRQGSQVAHLTPKFKRMCCSLQ